MLRKIILFTCLLFLPILVFYNAMSSPNEGNAINEDNAVVEDAENDNVVSEKIEVKGKVGDRELSGQEVKSIANWLKISMDNLSKLLGLEIKIVEAKETESESVEDTKVPEEKNIEEEKSPEVNVMARNEKDKSDGLPKTSGTKSLMYTENDFGRVSEAIRSFKGGIRYEDVLAIAEEEEARAKEAFPEGGIVKEVLEATNEVNEYSIYLNSIIYFSPSRWAVWLNGERIASGEEYSDGLNIISVTKDEVEVLWKISLAKWNILFPGSRNSNLVINENNEVEKKFILKINQTYLPLTDEIIEGRR